jgi:hypothetical protein
LFEEPELSLSDVGHGVGELANVSSVLAVNSIEPRGMRS